MTEQNKIWDWREEFERQYDEKTNKNNGVAYHFLVSGKYCFEDIENQWQGFLMAKRNMPVIEIPEYDIHHYAPVRNIIAQLENFGIQYTIKGD